MNTRLSDLVADFTQATPLCIARHNNLLTKFIAESIKFFSLMNQSSQYFLQLGDYIWTSECFDKSNFTQMASKRKCRIFDYLFQQRYFNHITLDKDYLVTNLSEKYLTFFNGDPPKTIYDSWGVAECHNTIDITNKCSVLCDSFKRHGTIYSMTLELIELRYSKLLDTKLFNFPDKIVSSDLLLFCFLDKYSQLITEIVGTDLKGDRLEPDGTYMLHGIYKLRLERVEQKWLKNTSRIIHIDEDGNVSTTRTEFDNSQRHRYYYLMQKNDEVPEPKYSDEHLIDIFKPKKPKKKKKKQLETKDSSSDDDESILSPFSEIISKPEPLRILFKPNAIKNTESIIKILTNLIQNNYYFQKMYNDFGQIYIFKDYDKDYTSQQYINWQFETPNTDWRQSKRSKSFHGYLTSDLSEITRVTYIECISI